MESSQASRKWFLLTASGEYPNAGSYNVTVFYWRDWVALELDSTDMMDSANEVLKLVSQVNLKLRLYIE